MKKVLVILTCLVAVSCTSGPALRSTANYIEENESSYWYNWELLSVEQLENMRWSTEKANSWFAENDWPNGANFTPSTAINQLEMWDKDTFDLQTIDRELKWASDIGFNTMRVFLHYLSWREDPQGFLDRVDQYLEVSMKYNIKTAFVFFDSVWDPEPVLGKQREPQPGIHNSGWVQSPGNNALVDADQYPLLKEYVQETMSKFRDSNAILFWDLYNEPDNPNIPKYRFREPDDKWAYVYRLLTLSYTWGREINPSQPMTSGVWTDKWSPDKIEKYPFVNLQLRASDIISFHEYNDKEGTLDRVKELLSYNRPIICTEYMARGFDSTFENIMPMFKEYNVGAINWGFCLWKNSNNIPMDFMVYSL